MKAPAGFFLRAPFRVQLPIVKTENIPDHTLHEDLMLVHGNERAQRTGSELSKNDAVTWSVSVEHPEWCMEADGFVIHSSVFQFFNYLGLGFSHHKRFCLSEEIRKKLCMVITDRVVGDRRRDEVTGHDLRSLMNQLIKSVLSICTGFTPDDRSCLIYDGLTVPVGRLSVALHISLLKVGSKAVHILIIG